MNLNQLKESVDHLASLIADPSLKQEYRVYRCSFKRLRIRFRNNIFIGNLKQLATINYRLQIDYPSVSLTTYVKRILDQKDEKKRLKIMGSFAKTMCGMINFLDVAIDKGFHIFTLTQRHMRVGHLTHHLITLRACISRIWTCLRAMLVYASDILMELIYLTKKKTLLGYDDVRNILVKHDCKPRIERQHESNSDHNEDTEMIIVEPSNESIAKRTRNTRSKDCEVIGQLIDRKTRRPRI